MTRELWDREAATFDDEADHGLADPAIRQAWRILLLEVLPPAPSRVADLGCGTGTLTQLLAGEGYVVDGVDFSEEMLRRARTKVPSATFVLGDAAEPPLAPGTYDVVLCRHVLWALPDPGAVIGRWVRLLRTGGALVLVEGRWGTGAGLTSEEAAALVGRHRSEVTVRHLRESAYWGREIDDQRYLLLSRR